jgi:VWFA-related protein
MVVKTLAQEKPRLRDFGSSLKKGSRKNKDESQNKKQDGGESDEVIRVQTDLVVCDVLVVNDQSHAIPGLERGDFVVREDGNQQEVGTFSLGDDAKIPRSLVLIIDYSHSEAPYIKTSVEAAKVLVDKLGPQDRMALVTDDVKLLVDFTQDKALLRKNLDSLRKKAASGSFGDSHQYSALMATLNEMFSKEDPRPIVIFQTDGDQLTTFKVGGTLRTSFSFQDVRTTVEKSRATIYTIIPGGSLLDLTPDEKVERVLPLLPAGLGRQAMISFAERWSKQQLAIADLAKLSGGWHDFLEKPEQADEVYARILADINHRYVIGYYPTNKTRDGKERTIKIEVRGHPEYIVWGRKTYFAPVD